MAKNIKKFNTYLSKWYTLSNEGTKFNKNANK